MATNAELIAQGFDLDNAYPRTTGETRTLLSGEGRMQRQHDLVRAGDAFGLYDDRHYASGPRVSPAYVAWRKHRNRRQGLIRHWRHQGERAAAAHNATREAVCVARRIATEAALITHAAARPARALARRAA